MSVDTGINDVRTFNLWRAVFAEFFGMILFLLCVTTVAIPWGNSDVNISSNNVEIGIGIGLAIASIATMIGHVSGGHLNPAVSVGCIVAGRIPVIQGLLYIVAQTVGAVVGTALTYACVPDNMLPPSNNATTLGVTSLTPGLRPEQGFGLELLFTLILVFHVLAITDPINRTEKYGTCLGIGVVILVCHVCLIPFTGCGINPARSFGPAVVMDSWEHHWVYWIGPILGGVLAPVLYKFLFYAEEKKHIEQAQNGENTIMIS